MSSNRRTPAPSAPRRDHRLDRASWLFPVVGFIATYLLVAGASLSNVDNRPQAEVLGLAALALFPAIGLALTWRAGVPRIGLVVNLALAALVVALAWQAYEARQPEAGALLVPPRSAPGDASRPKRIWIDTDPACGLGETADVDDCWALALALRSPEVEVVGVSTVFGNRPRDGSVSQQRRVGLVREILALAGQEAPVFAGAEKENVARRAPTPASAALAAALAEGRLTIVALGPASNIATLLARHPERAGQIEQVIMVAGKPPGRLFHPGKHWWFHFGDFNVSQDVAAMDAVLRSGVPVTLVPFDLGITLAVTGQDLDRLRARDGLAAALARASTGWLSFWTGGLMEQRGFSPFDAFAVGYAAMPERFTCRSARARIGFSVFLAPFGLGRDVEVDDDIAGMPVRYCEAVPAEFKEILLRRLGAPLPVIEACRRRPRRAEQGPRLRGCDPGAGCRRPAFEARPRHPLCCPTPLRGALGQRAGAPFGRDSAGCAVPPPHRG